MYRNASIFFREHSGISMVEVIITFGVIGVIAVASLGGLFAMRSRAGLEDAHTSMIRAFEGARSRAATGVGGTSHGVHIESGTMTVFEGPSYVPGYGTETSFPPSVSVDPPQATVLFSRLTAAADQALFVTLSGAQGDSRTITVTAEGAIIPE